MISLRLKRWAARAFAPLRRDSRGLALTEFAFALPILMVLMASGLELANFVLATKRMGDLAVLVADNASRMGKRGTSNINAITEAEINDVFIGAALQSGALDMENHGRIILSSLQQNEDGGQWIAWQRCFGNLEGGSLYGEQGDGRSGTGFPGMGPADRMITAPAGTAVMVVELAYEYQPVVGVVELPFGTIRELAVFNVREARDLSDDPPNPEGVEPSRCE